MTLWITQDCCVHDVSLHLNLNEKKYLNKTFPFCSRWKMWWYNLTLTSSTESTHVDVRCGGEGSWINIRKRIHPSCLYAYVCKAGAQFLFMFFRTRYVTITISIPTALKGRFDTKCVGLLFIYYWNIIKTLWMKESHDLFPPPHPLNASPLKFTFYPPAENHLNDCTLGIIPNPFSPLPASKTWHILGLGSSQWYMVSTHDHNLMKSILWTQGKIN